MYRTMLTSLMILFLLLLPWLVRFLVLLRATRAEVEGVEPKLRAWMAWSTSDHTGV